VTAEGRPPIIIIGMHRSGTTMIARMLEKLGLFVGKRKEVNHEALFFRAANDWIVHTSGGNWDNPSPVHFILTNSEVHALVADYLRYLLKTPHIVGYLGWARYIRFRSLFHLPFPWGWKDPLNTYTLPFWLPLFPEAKVIHIYRNGVDVARSLLARAQNELNRAGDLHCRRKKYALYAVRKKSVGFVNAPRCLDLKECFRLWEAYAEKSFSYQDLLGNRILHLKYEEFVLFPVEKLRNLAEFCNLPNPGSERLSHIAGASQPERVYAYRQDRTSTDLYEAVRNTRWMRELGY